MHAINRTPRYDANIAAIREKYRTVIDVAISELEPTLRRNPTIYPVIIGKDIYRISVNSPDMPSISVYFRYDETTVYLLRAVQWESEE
jgi:hypothetical protein